MSNDYFQRAPGMIELPRPKAESGGRAPGDGQSEVDKKQFQELDRVSFLEAALKHENELAAFAEGQKVLSGREAIDDPMTGNQGLTRQTKDWLQQHDQALKPVFRLPETESLYRSAVERRNQELLALAEDRQKRAEESHRDQVLQSNVDHYLDNRLQDVSPDSLAALEAEIEAGWNRPDEQARRAEARDGCYRRITEKMLAEGQTGQAGRFMADYEDRFKAQTLEELKDQRQRLKSEQAFSSQGLAELLPDLVRSERADILANGRSSLDLEGLYQAAEASDWPEEKKKEYLEEHRAAVKARQWLDKPQNAFKPMAELLAQAEKDLKAPEAEGENNGRSHELAVAGLQQQWQSLLDDPIGYVSGPRDSTIDRLVADGRLSDSRPAELMQAKIALGRALAKKLGLENNDTVLSASEAEQFSQDLALTADPQERLNKLEHYENLFGRYAQRAFRQLKVGAAESLAVKLKKNSDPSVKAAVINGFKNLDRRVDPKNIPEVRQVEKTLKELSRTNYGLALKNSFSGRPGPAWDDLAGFYDLGQALALGAGENKDQLKAVKTAFTDLKGD